MGPLYKVMVITPANETRVPTTLAIPRGLWRSTTSNLHEHMARLDNKKDFTAFDIYTGTTLTSIYMGQNIAIFFPTKNVGRGFSLHFIVSYQDLCDVINATDVTYLSITAMINVRQAIVLIIDATSVGEVHLRLVKYILRVNVTLRSIQDTYRLIANLWVFNVFSFFLFFWVFCCVKQ